MVAGGMNNVVKVVDRTVVQERVTLEIRKNVVNVVNTLAKNTARAEGFVWVYDFTTYDFNDINPKDRSLVNELAEVLFSAVARACGEKEGAA
jgi:hypothetical protein